MSSSESVEPLGFFSLPRELRDEIYDILHQLQDEAEFGADGQLVVRFPLPRLHHISRWFTEECDSRAPARPLIVITQKHGDFQWACDQKHAKRVKCPRIVNLRRKRMQKRHLIRRLHVNLYACNPTDGAAQSSPALFNSIHARLSWIKAFVQNTRFLADDLDIHTRLMLNDVEDIQAVRISQHLRSLWKQGPAAGPIEIVVDCPGEHEYHEDEFTRAKTLALWRPESGWWFDEQEIRKCQALAELRSDWSIASTSPKSSQGEESGEYPVFEDDDRSPSPLTIALMAIINHSDP